MTSPRGFWSAWKGKKLAQRWGVSATGAEGKFEKAWAILAFIPRQKKVSLGYHKERGTPATNHLIEGLPSQNI